MRSAPPDDDNQASPADDVQVSQQGAPDAMDETETNGSPRTLRSNVRRSNGSNHENTHAQNRQIGYKEEVDRFIAGIAGSGNEYFTRHSTVT